MAILWWKYKPVYSASLVYRGKYKHDAADGTVVLRENGFGSRELEIIGCDYVGDRDKIKLHPWYRAFARPWVLGTLSLDDVQNGRTDDMHLFPDGKVSRYYDETGNS